MKKLIFLILFLIPFISFGQECTNEVIFYSYTTENDQEQVGTTSGGGSVKHAIYIPASSTNEWFGKATMKIGKYNSPTDDIILDFKGGDTTSTLISLASTTINYTELDGFPSFTTYDWILENDIPLNATTSYWLELYRSGSLHDTNNYVFRDQSSGATAPYGLYRYGTAWTELFNRDGYLVLAYCDDHTVSTSTMASSTPSQDFKEMSYIILVSLVFIACGYVTYKIVK